MRAFYCTCETKPQIFFENRVCNSCQRPLGFVDTTLEIRALEPSDAGTFTCEGSDTVYVRCKNGLDFDACNGYLRMDSVANMDNHGQLCFACNFNNVIPNLSIPKHIDLWRELEAAKRRTLFTLNRLRLPMPDKGADPENGLSFNFSTDKSAGDHFQSKLVGIHPVFTGHSSGEITINLAEADDVARELSKQQLEEAYRTTLGHLRHEIGHFYWDLLIQNDHTHLAKFTSLFGDSSLDYQEAMDRHYDEGAPENWHESYVSAYATMHPWEDWAETWAHYLHMIDTLETAQAHQLLTHEQLSSGQSVFATPIDRVIQIWLEFTIKLNALNRSLGMPDAYPFVLSETVCEKIRFIDSVANKNSD